MSAKMFNIISRHLLAILVFLCGLTLLFAAYWPGLQGDFLLDDIQNIQRPIRALEDFNLSSLLNFVLTNDSGMLGRPVSMFSFALTAGWHGVEPWGFKFDNLLIHCTTGIIVFFLTSNLLQALSHSRSESTQARSQMISWISLVVSFFWLLHPLQVSTVLYAVQRMAMLSALFTALSLLVYIKGRLLLEHRPRLARVFMFLMFPLSGLLAVFSKEDGALIPFFIVLIEVVVFRLDFRGRGWLTEKRFYCLVYGLLPVVATTLYVVINWSGLTTYGARNFNLVERLMTELHVVAMYMKAILLPRLADMSLYHDVTVVKKMDLATWGLLAGLVILAASVLLLRRKAPVLSFGIGWFLVSHLMESTFIGLELVFEHRNYLALFGLVLPVVYYLFQYLQSQVGKGVLFAVLVSGLGFMTAVRAKEWSNTDLMLEVAVVEQPGSLRALVEYANRQINYYDFEGGLETLEKVELSAPYDYGAVAQQLMLRCQLQLDVEEKVSLLRERAASQLHSPYSFSALEGLIRLMSDGSCPQITPEMLMPVYDAMLANPVLGKGQYYAYALRHKGYLYFMKNDIQSAYDQMIQAWDADQNPTVLYELASLLISNNFIGDAQLVIQKYHEVNAESLNIYDNQIAELEDKLADRLAEIEAARIQVELESGFE